MRRDEKRTSDFFARRAVRLLPVLAALTISVVDADTVEQAGVRWRLIGLDAPEVHSAKCPEERRQGLIAAARLITLLEERGGHLVPATGRGRDKYGRRLGRLFLGAGDSPAGSRPPALDWAEIAVAERHAVPWDGRGRRHNWCGGEG